MVKGIAVGAPTASDDHESVGSPVQGGEVAFRRGWADPGQLTLAEVKDADCVCRRLAGARVAPCYRQRRWIRDEQGQAVALRRESRPANVVGFSNDRAQSTAIGVRRPQPVILIGKG